MMDIVEEHEKEPTEEDAVPVDAAVEDAVPADAVVEDAVP